MTLIPPNEIEELILELDKIVHEIRRRNSITDSRCVDEFFYLHKIEELKLLKGKLESTHMSLLKINEYILRNLDQICVVLKKDSQYLDLPNRMNVCERFLT